MHIQTSTSVIDHEVVYKRNLACFEQMYMQAHESVIVVKICRGYAGLYRQEERLKMIGEKIMDLTTARRVAQAFAASQGIPYFDQVHAFDKPVITVYHLHKERDNKTTQTKETIDICLPVRLGHDTLELVATDCLFKDIDGTEQTALKVAQRLALQQKALFIPGLGCLFNASLYQS